MSNIGWHRLNPSPTVNVGTTEQAKPIEKHEYLPPMRALNEMTEAQKETVRRYNSMRDMLIKHGLMDSKKEGGA